MKESDIKARKLERGYHGGKDPAKFKPLVEK